MHPRVPIFLWLLPAGFVLVGVIFFLRSDSAVTQASESARWSTVDGTVVSSTVSWSRDEEGQGGSRLGEVWYNAEVEYTYEVNGRVHRGDRVSFDFASKAGDDEKARKTVAKYPAGSSVTVHYDPASPDRSVLEPGMHESTALESRGGWILLAVGLVWFIVVFVEHVRRQQAPSED